MNTKVHGPGVKKVLSFLREGFPAYFRLPAIVESMGWKEPGGSKNVQRYLIYAVDMGWVKLLAESSEEGPFRLSAAGINKLNSWGIRDDRLVI